MLIRKYSYKNERGYFLKKQPLIYILNCMKYNTVKINLDIIQYILSIPLFPGFHHSEPGSERCSFHLSWKAR
jgi:hypothetical protein